MPNQGYGHNPGHFQEPYMSIICLLTLKHQVLLETLILQGVPPYVRSPNQLSYWCRYGSRRLKKTGLEEGTFKTPSENDGK